MTDEMLEFNFEGVEPATWGAFATMPKGEYNLQCLKAEKFNTKKDGSPGLKFDFIVTNHPTFTGIERSLWHVFPKDGNKDSWKYLLNTLMCLIPENPWQQDGIKIAMSELFQLAQGRPVNAMIDWEISTYEGKKRVNNSIKGLKKYDPSITQPVATEGNPPILTTDSPSPTATAASAGVPASEVQSFLEGSWPGSTETSAPAPANDFGLEPF